MREDKTEFVEHYNEDVYYWWLAVNGSSVSAAPIAMKGRPLVLPVPEQLFGFSTRAEQLGMQRFLLKAKPSEVDRRITVEAPEQLRIGELAYIRPTNPEEPTKGPTAWLS